MFGDAALTTLRDAARELAKEVADWKHIPEVSLERVVRDRQYLWVAEELLEIVERELRETVKDATA